MHMFKFSKIQDQVFSLHFTYLKISFPNFPASPAESPSLM